jgi:5-methylcytosine-specific restriction endonuclease McrA
MTLGESPIWSRFQRLTAPSDHADFVRIVDVCNMQNAPSSDDARRVVPVNSVACLCKTVLNKPFFAQLQAPHKRGVCNAVRKINDIRLCVPPNGRSAMTVTQWRRMLAWAGDACVCCHTPFSYGVLRDGCIFGADLPEKDHIVPRSKHGGNRIENIQPLCGRCNVAKGDKTVDYRDPSWRTAVLWEARP